MPSPFPGMDPYLEHPAGWPGRHNMLIAALHLDLAPRLRPRYVVHTERRTYLREPDDLVFIGQPDVSIERAIGPAPTGTEPSPGSARGALAVQVPVPDEVREAFLEIRDADSGELVTVLEVLSPTNKVPGEGRALYEQKRRAILGSATNLVEIDLLRIGRPLPVHPVGPTAGDYRVLVARADRRPRGDLWLFGVRDPLPVFALPLRRGDEEPTVDLRALLDDLYDRAGWDLTLGYAREPVPPLREDDRAWSDDRLRSAGCR